MKLHFLLKTVYLCLYKVDHILSILRYHTNSCKKSLMDLNRRNIFRKINVVHWCSAKSFDVIGCFLPTNRVCVPYQHNQKSFVYLSVSCVFYFIWFKFIISFFKWKFLALPVFWVICLLTNCIHCKFTDTSLTLFNRYTLSVLHTSIY